MLNKFMKGPARTENPVLPDELIATPGANRESEHADLIASMLVDAKVRVHRKLIEDLNLASLERMPREDAAPSNW